MSSVRRDDPRGDDGHRGDRAFYESSHRGGMILAFGIVALVLFGFCGVGLIFGAMAWVMGNNDLRAMEAGEMDPAGQSLTLAGKVCGGIGAIMGVLYAMFLVAYTLFIFAVFAL